MNACDCVLAVVLLSSPVSEPSAPEAACLASWARPAVLQVALDQQILDPREEQFLRNRSENLMSDWRMLQARWEEFEAVPMVEECLRFPARKVVNELLTFNRSYRKELQSRLAIDVARGEDLRHALAETDQLYRIWDAVRDSRCEFYYVTVRRQALAQLRQWVGEQAYYTSQLPPHVPVWRFSVLD